MTLASPRVRPNKPISRISPYSGPHPRSKILRNSSQEMLDPGKGPNKGISLNKPLFRAGSKIQDFLGRVPQNLGSWILSRIRGLFGFIRLFGPSPGSTTFWMIRAYSGLFACWAPLPPELSPPPMSNVPVAAVHLHFPLARTQLHFTLDSLIFSE